MTKPLICYAALFHALIGFGLFAQRAEATPNKLVNPPKIELTFAVDKIEHITGTSRNFKTTVKASLTGKFNTKYISKQYKYHGIQSVWMQAKGCRKVVHKVSQKTAKSVTYHFYNQCLINYNDLRRFCMVYKGGGVYQVPLTLGVSYKTSIYFNGKRRHMNNTNVTKATLRVKIKCGAASVSPLIKKITSYELSCPPGYKFNNTNAKTQVTRLIRRSIRCIKK